MKNFKQLIKELPSSKVVVGFGSFQPPTSVHEHLIKSVKAVAGSSADYAIYASANEDKKYNPLSVDRKVYFLNRMFPGTNFQETAEQTIVGLAKKLNEKYKALTVVVGEDKVADVTKQLTKANGKEYTFESIKVVSTGMTDPDSDLTPGVSGMRMCESAKAGKFEDFKKGLPHTLTEHDSRRLMNEVRKGLGQEPIKEQVVLAKDKIREDYFNGKIFNVGDIVESSGQQYEIVKRGSNHLLLKEESGALVSKWIQDVTLVTEQQEEEMKEVSKETIRKKYKQIVKKATMSEPPVEIGEPTKGDGKEQPKFGDKIKKNESNFSEDVYTSDTKTKDYQTKDAEGNWVWRKRKVHPRRINFAASRMGGAPDNVPTTMPTEGYVKKTAYQKLNARMKTLTGKSLDDRSKEMDKERQETLARIAQYKKDGIIKTEETVYEISEGVDKEHPIVKEYDSLKKHDIKTLRGMIGQQQKIVDTSEFKFKDHAISHYLRNKHGNSKVAAAFGLKEDVLVESEIHELGIRHDEPLSRREHIKNVIAKHGGKVTGQSDKATYVSFPADKVHAAKKDLKAGNVHPDHWINGDFNEEKQSYGSWVLKQKASKTLKVKPESKEKVEESTLNPNNPHADYKAKKKALQDLQLDKNTHKDPELQKQIIQRHKDLDAEYGRISIGEAKKPKSLKNLKKEINDKESLATTNKNPPFDAFSSTNC